MHTIVLATQKGGSGKSTLAIGLAVAATLQGHRVRLLDADPQGTVSKWAERRTNPEPSVTRVSSGSEIEQTLRYLERDGFDIAIVDTAGTDSALSLSAIEAADLCLIPARPSPTDIEAAAPTLRAIRKLEKPFAFLLNQTPARSYRLSEAGTALGVMGVLALPYIVLRNDHQDALGAGLAVSEFAPDGKAADEIRALWQWVWKRLSPETFAYEQTAIRASI
jgi:chromosome partitioning protein